MPAAFLDGGGDRGEVVVEEHEVRDLSADVAPSLAHGHPDIGTLEGGRIVDPVAGHGDDFAPVLESVDECQLVLGAHAGKHTHARDGLAELVGCKGVEVIAGEGMLGGNAEARRDGLCGCRVIAGDHEDPDACVVGSCDGVGDFCPWGVPEPGRPEPGQILLAVHRRPGEAEDAVALGCRRFDATVPVRLRRFVEVAALE